MMFGDITIPIEERKNWVWEQLALVCPEMKRENFPVDDPYMLGEIVLNNCYHYKPKVDDLVMDIGANVGVFSAFCALKGARVLAYEPNSAAYEMLRETIKRNALGDTIIPLALAIWNDHGECSYHPSVTPPSGTLQTWTSYNGAVDCPGADPNEKTACVSFADAIGDVIWDCVKMDIEGAEFSILPFTEFEVFRHIKFLTVELHNGHATKTRHDSMVERLEHVFHIEGIKDGDPRWAHEDRYISLFCTRR